MPNDETAGPGPTRVYTIGQPMTEEQIAVTFAMTSRSPEPFDEIATRVSETRAADFNERWVRGYGHASVAEHASIHMAIENVSRLACDLVESNRLGSYTERSSRYQRIGAHDYHVPAELEPWPGLREEYTEAMEKLFDCYGEAIETMTTRLDLETPRNEEESVRERRLRIW